MLSIVWWIPLLGWQKLLCLWWPAVIFSCQYRKLRSVFTFFTSCRTQWWCGTVRSQQMLLFPPICSPAAGPKQPHVWNCVTRRISRAVRRWAVWCADWDALTQRSLPRKSFGLTQCDPVTQNLCHSFPVLLSPAHVSLHSLRSQSSDWGFSQDLPKERFPAFQETSINVWVETLCSSHTAEIVLVERQVINLDPKECQLQASLRQ